MKKEYQFPVIKTVEIIPCPLLAGSTPGYSDDDPLDDPSGGE